MVFSSEDWGCSQDSDEDSDQDSASEEDFKPARSTRTTRKYVSCIAFLGGGGGGSFGIFFHLFYEEEKTPQSVCLGLLKLLCFTLVVQPENVFYDFSSHSLCTARSKFLASIFVLFLFSHKVCISSAFLYTLCNQKVCSLNTCCLPLHYAPQTYCLTSFL